MITVDQRCSNQRKIGTDMQQLINRRHQMGFGNVFEIYAAVVMAHANLPQYNGKWDGHYLVRVTADVTTKLGGAFKEGDITIGKMTEAAGQVRWSLYSFRNGCETVVHKDHVADVSVFQMARSNIYDLVSV